MIPQEDSTSGSQNLSSTSNTMIASYSPAIMPISSSISSNQSLQQTNSVSIATTQADLQVESPSYTSAQMQLLMFLLYGSLAVFAVAANALVCRIVISKMKVKSATNYFIVNLAVGDILMALLCIPFTFVSNLVYGYWPFGLLLCVVVNFSQTVSVFVSVYTMVAISIDKYSAIIHPLRPRMSKRIAKSTIGVIWSAAMITSLPTVLLTSLRPSSNGATSQAATATSSSSASSSAPLPQPPSQINLIPSQLSLTTQAPNIIPSSTQVTPVTSQTTASTALIVITQQQQQQASQQQPEVQNMICQEVWPVLWPHARYYYSMALMFLQFVLPLGVLVVTYARIVVVIWFKETPGEEYNARDAQIARSKRKMIKMVMFCVIAFALTWLPFNALVVIGDSYPSIWELNFINYVWFVTHYLAMCHTITNPIIYVWMNKRFRSGFAECISEMLAFVFRPFQCLGCPTISSLSTNANSSSQSQFTKQMNSVNNESTNKRVMSASAVSREYDFKTINNSSIPTTGAPLTGSAAHSNHSTLDKSFIRQSAVQQQTFGMPNSVIKLAQQHQQQQTICLSTADKTGSESQTGVAETSLGKRVGVAGCADSKMLISKQPIVKLTIKEPSDHSPSSYQQSNCERQQVLQSLLADGETTVSYEMQPVSFEEIDDDDEYEGKRDDDHHRDRYDNG